MIWYNTELNFLNATPDNYGMTCSKLDLKFITDLDVFSK